MGADYSFELIFIETYAPQFIEHNKFFLGIVFTTMSFVEVFTNMQKKNGTYYCGLN